MLRGCEADLHHYISTSLRLLTIKNRLPDEFNAATAAGAGRAREALLGAAVRRCVGVSGSDDEADAASAAFFHGSLRAIAINAEEAHEALKCCGCLEWRRLSGEYVVSCRRTKNAARSGAAYRQPDEEVKRRENKDEVVPAVASVVASRGPQRWCATVRGTMAAVAITATTVCARA